MDLNTQKILDLLDRLLGPNGCPWSRGQSAETLCHHIIEESYEVIDAISTQKADKIEEEMGDVLFATLFTLVVACKSHKLEPEHMIEQVVAKITRRHPHVFENPRPMTLAELRIQWEQIKAKERESQNKGEKDDFFAAITASMPLVIRAMKLIELGASQGFQYKADETTLEGRFLQLVIEGLDRHQNLEQTFERGLLDYRRQLEKWLLVRPSFEKEKTGDDLTT